MKNLAILIFALVGFSCLADSSNNRNQFTDGLLTNVPTVLSAGSVSNINSIIETHSGHGVALFPTLVATNGSVSNFVVTVSFAKDRTLQNWTTTTRSYTNALNGTSPVTPYIQIPVADTDSTCAIKVNSLASLDGVQTTIVSNISYSVRY